METHVETFVTNWREALASKDSDKLHALLADEMTFYSPVLFRPATDRTYIETVLSFVEDTFEDFEYVDQYEQDGGVAMLFKAKVGDLAVDGVDFFKINAEGKASELKVMLRPLNATMLLAQTMKDKFEAMSAS